MTRQCTGKLPNPDRPALLDAEGRVAFIAGAAGGIGGATLELLRACGARIAAADLDTAGLPPESDEILPLAMDATDETAVAMAVDAAAERFGGIDWLINAVGVVGAGPLVQMSLAEWRNAMDVNLTSCFLLAREGYRRLRKPGGGMVMMSSSNGRNGGNALSGAAYAASKAGVINLTRHLAREWAGDGLRVNCIAPGPVATQMLDRLSEEERTAIRVAIPLGRYAEATEIAAAIAYLCSPHTASMTGTVTNISGGLVLD